MADRTLNSGEILILLHGMGIYEDSSPDVDALISKLHEWRNGPAHLPAGAIGSDVWPGLGKVVEECGELLQLLGKIIAFPSLGPEAIHPDGTVPAELLQDELGDLEAAMLYFCQANPVIDTDRRHERRRRKIALFNEWDRQERSRRNA